MKQFAVGVLLLISLALFFQNCGKAGFENQELSFSDASSQDVDDRLKPLPFPYDVSVNQIAHMSCMMNNQSASNQSAYFSWKVGAFDNPSDVPSAALGIRPAGLQLTSEFQTQWKKTAATYDTAMQPIKLKEFLSHHPYTANRTLQLSFRSTNYPGTTLMKLPNGSNSPTTSFMQPISSPEMVESFKDLPVEPRNVFPNSPDFASRFLEASLIVGSGYGDIDTMLKSNYDSSYMALGFVQNSGDQAGVALASSVSDGRYAFGKGFRVHFGRTNPYQGTNAFPPSDSLVVVEEQDLATGYNVPGVAWDCSYRFKIVRNKDRYNPMYRANHFARAAGGACPGPTVTSDYCSSPVDSGFGLDPSKFSGQCPANRPRVYNMPHCEEHYYQTCPQEPFAGNPADPIPANRTDGLYHPNYPLRPAILHALRRFLPANQWDINVSRGCIVPKVDDNTCYQNSTIVYDEMFFTGTAANPAVGQHQGCGIAGQYYQCASYLTLCLRK